MGALVHMTPKTMYLLIQRLNTASFDYVMRAYKAGVKGDAVELTKVYTEYQDIIGKNVKEIAGYDKEEIENFVV